MGSKNKDKKDKGEKKNKVRSETRTYPAGTSVCLPSGSVVESTGTLTVTYDERGNATTSTDGDLFFVSRG